MSFGIPSPPNGWGLQKPPLGVPVDQGHPLGKGVVYSFAENTGLSSMDAARLARPMSIVGPTWSNGGLKLTGSGDYAYAANSAPLNPERGSFACRFSVAGTYLGSSKPLILKSFTSHTPPYYQYGIFAQDTSPYPRSVGFFCAISGTIINVFSKNTGWNYSDVTSVVGVCTGQLLIVYVNGRRCDAAAAVGAISSYDTDLYIGAFDNLAKTSTYCFPGSIFDVRVSPTVWGDDDVRRYHQEPYSMFEGDSMPMVAMPPQRLVRGMNDMQELPGGILG